MTEVDWLKSESPTAMLDHLLYRESHTRDEDGEMSRVTRERREVSDRQLRLFLVACCRAVWSRLTDDRLRHAVEVAERFADRQASIGEMRNARYVASDAARGKGAYWTAVWLPFYATMPEVPTENGQHWMRFTDHDQGQVAEVLRCVFGNPFRPVTLCGCDPDVGINICEWCELLTPTVRAIAAAIYEERRFEDAPVLADALEEAGVDQNEELMLHLRGYERCPDCLDEAGEARSYCRTCEGSGRMGRVRRKTACVRGCWVFDAILGKS